MYEKIGYDSITNEELLKSIKIMKGMIEGDTSDAFVIIFNKVKNILMKKSMKYYSITEQEREDLIVDVILEVCKKFNCEDGSKGFYKFLGDRYVWLLKDTVCSQGMQKRKANFLADSSSHAQHLFEKGEAVSPISPIKILREQIIPSIKTTKFQQKLMQELVFAEGDQQYLAKIKSYNRKSINNTLQDFRKRLKNKNITIADCYV